jgi:hypothetical protein
MIQLYTIWLYIKRNPRFGKRGFKVQEYKRDKPSRIQDSELPGTRETEIVAAAVVPVAADVETPGEEKADVDVIAVRVDRECTDVHILEEADTTNIKEDRDEPARLGGVRDILDTGDELVLFIPVLVRRVCDLCLLDSKPAGASEVVLCERYTFIPSTRLRIKMGGLGRADIEQ